MTDLRLYLAQRISAAILAPMVLLHLGMMIYAIQGGLSADEILARTRGSLGWGLFYGCFVGAVALHAAIGLRTILGEWAGLRGLPRAILCWIIALALLGLGLRAVYAVVAA